MSPKEIKILDKNFREFIPESEIKIRIGELAEQINTDYERKEVLFLGILNGAFLFAAELYKRITVKSKISFVKLASYEGTSSSGSIKELIGWNEEIKGKDVIIIEDIVDTGITLERIVDELRIRKAKSIKVAALLLKPDAYTKKITVDYTGFRIPSDFVVGFGLDYNGFGRNLPSVYRLFE